MDPTTSLRLKASTLERYGLPDIEYPVPQGLLEQVIANGGDFPLELLLHGLQQRYQDGKTDWQQAEPAMAKLAELLTPPDDLREAVIAQGDDWWLEIGPVDLTGQLVTIQRGEHLVAAIAGRADGRLRVAVFRPLDGKSAGYLTGLSHIPHPEYGVNMRQNNWEYALDCSHGMGNVYAANGGEAYLSYWESGLGLSRDGTVLPVWHSQRSLTPRLPAQVAMELGVHYTCSDEESSTA
jgi:hypothetical protein